MQAEKFTCGTLKRYNATIYKHNIIMERNGTECGRAVIVLYIFVEKGFSLKSQPGTVALPLSPLCFSFWSGETS